MTKLANTTRNRSPRNGSKAPSALGEVPPEAPPPGITSPPVSRFATLNASAATRTIARNRSSGSAHSVLPRHDCDFRRQHEERADRRQGHGDAQGERDRHAFRVQDLAALVGEFVVDPLPPLIDALHEAGRLELLEMLEEGRLAQGRQIAQI